MEGHPQSEASKSPLSTFLAESRMQIAALRQYTSEINDGDLDIQDVYRHAELSTSALLSPGPYLLTTKKPETDADSTFAADGDATETGEGAVGDVSDEGDEDQVDEKRSDTDTDSEGYFSADDDTQGNTSVGDLVIKGAVKGNLIRMHDFLGTEYTQRIMELQKVEPLADNTHMPSSPLEHQRSGAAKCIKLIDGPNHGGILADEMGLGKTLCALWAAMTVKEQVPGAFSLVVTTKTCTIQWAETCTLQFPPGRTPKIKIIDKATTARELISSGYDVVICSYGLLRHQYKTMVDFEVSYGQRSGRANSDGKVPKAKAMPTRRPILSLFSQMYHDIGMPIKVLILDEVQYAKNPKGLTHEAIKALWYSKVLMLSGTFLANRWSDVYGILDFLPGHPFGSLSIFNRHFASRLGGKWGDPQQTQIHRLQKFLMAVTISRPDTLLNLPGKVELVRRFKLSDEESRKVLRYTKQYIDMIQATKGGEERVQKEGYAHVNQEDKKLFAAAQRAQQHAANPCLLPDEEIAKSSRDKELLKMIAKIRSLAMQKLNSEEVDSIEGIPRPTNDEAEDVKQQELMHQERLTNAIIAVIQSGARSSSVGNKHLVQAGDDGDIEDDDFGRDLEDSEDDIDAIIQSTSREPNRKKWLARVRAMSDQELFSSRVTCFIEVFDEIQEEFPGERIIVFSKFLKFLDLCEEALKRRRNIHALRFDGTTSAKDRERVKAIFDKSDGNQPVLITPGAGGVGLNLASASKMIVCEPWWNGNDARQAHRRMYRFGQDKICHVWLLVAANSAIDVLIKAASDKKLVINDKIMGPLRRLDHEEPVIPTIARYY